MLEGIIGTLVVKRHVPAARSRGPALAVTAIWQRQNCAGSCAEYTCKRSGRLVSVRIADVAKRIECIATSGPDKVNGFAPHFDKSISSIQRPLPRGEKNGIAACRCVHGRLDAGCLPRT